MKKLITGLMIFYILTLISCGNQDAEINNFTEDFDRLTMNIVTKINSNPTVAGIDEAQEIFDRKKDVMKEKINNLNQLHSYQLSDKSAKELSDCVEKNLTAINYLKVEYMEEVLINKNFGEKLNKLVLEFNAISGV